eukprot:COSAG04_NODE_18078_length_451_cov_1.173295_1_plen_56_part_00
MAEGKRIYQTHEPEALRALLAKLLAGGGGGGGGGATAGKPRHPSSAALMAPVLAR